MYALSQEIDYYGRQLENTGYEVKTIFIGGGTPSCIDAVYITALMTQLHHAFLIAADAEITIEANPGTLSQDKLSAYRAAGINRLSIGLQSADYKELKLLGRIHTWEQFEENFMAARASGFSDINVDLMTALPTQTCYSLRRTIEQIIKLNPEHISAYSLIIEEGTPFADLYKETSGEMIPDEDVDRQMYAMTQSLLSAAGYHQYEISNYAKEGFESRHNKVYWQRGEYLGMGLGASSLMKENRWKNESDLMKYIEQVSKETAPNRFDIESLNTKAQMEEFMFLGLRMTKGISEQDFLKCFHRTVDEVYGNVINELMQEGLITKYSTQNGYFIRLTPRGMDISNYVFVKFL